jgi:hypothetical protein
MGTGFHLSEGCSAPAFVYVLIGGGAVLAFGAGGYLGARSVGRRLDARTSGSNERDGHSARRQQGPPTAHVG